MLVGYAAEEGGKAAMCHELNECLKCISSGNTAAKISEERMREIVPHSESQARNAVQRHKYSTIVVFEMDYTSVLSK
ncbi:hypothetical protein Y032_0120g936 [Ancylostoma ceylanicum]|uniref:Uncharacterized protein n=1 Tax=Ancylostoma ceylanicum TaxID=53326 RepID=A0A016TAX4_9BILA|nr:hypothetical protein Y032_0120g936 [Ancylostoma ceylanicum]